MSVPGNNVSRVLSQTGVAPLGGDSWKPGLVASGLRPTFLFPVQILPCVLTLQ